MRSPRNRSPSSPVRHVSPEALAWLHQIHRQLAYDEYMQARRERWLWERPPRKRLEEGMDYPEHPPVW